MSKLDNNSFSIGFIEGIYGTTQSLLRSESQRYLNLCKELEYEGDDEIIEYIKRYHG